jgi:hypothetical protein
MDFHQLLAKMQELDSPAEENITNEMGCGMEPPVPPMSQEPPPAPHPSMSVNLNAQGMENIENLMKLFQRVNPDMMPKTSIPAPSLTSAPSIISIKPSEPSLKMLPDMDADNDLKPGGELDLDNDDSDYDNDGKLDPHEKDHSDEKPLLRSLDLDKDGDHDLDDHGLEKKNKDEAYANEPDEISVKTGAFPFDAKGNDLHKSKGTYPKVSGADNPMQKMENSDLRSQIRAELQKRLSESKRR